MDNLNEKNVLTSQRKDPLEGITLKAILSLLVAKYGWEELGQRIAIKCFTNEPSINSSLKFLRKTPWARQKVESLYIKTKTPNDTLWAAALNKRHTEDQP